MTGDPKKLATEKALPFEPLVPNKETIEAMKAAERGEVTTVGHPRNLLKSLNAD
jgi:DNA-damage-inducible protein J